MGSTRLKGHLEKLGQVISRHRDELLIRLMGQGMPSHRRAETQARLLEAGRALICERGLGAVSVGELSLAAGFTRGAFYSNFPSMEAFINRLVAQEYDSMLAQLEEAARALAVGEWENSPLDPATLPSERAARVVKQIIPLLTLTPQNYFLRTEFSLYAARFPARSAEISREAAAFTHSLADMIEVLEEMHGLVPAMSPLDQAHVILAVFNRSAGEVLAGPNEAGRMDQTPAGASSTTEELTEIARRVLPALIAGMVKSA